MGTVLNYMYSFHIYIEYYRRNTGLTYHDSDSEAFGMDDLGNREFHF